jgi:hypothetical protein
LLAHIFSLLILGVTLGAQEVGEENHLDDDKEDKKLNAYNEPQGLANGHRAEAVIIQMKHL